MGKNNNIKLRLFCARFSFLILPKSCLRKFSTIAYDSCDGDSYLRMSKSVFKDSMG